MTEVQEHLLMLLREIDEICRENNIEFFLDGGSALGAVRHKGFLPWDDDADIVLTRENWLKFKKAVEEHPRPDRVLADPATNPAYPMVYPRYCDTSTTAILRTSMIDQFKSGLFIDIFILDPVEDTQEAVDEYFDILFGYCEYINPYYYDTVIGANEWYDFFKAMGAKEGRAAVDRYVEERLFRGEDKEGMTYCFRLDLAKYVYPRYLFRRQLFVPVEDTILPVPGEFGDYLRIHYGDLWYMIPKETEVETHNVAIDLSVPYENFADSYLWAIDKKEAESTYRKLQKLRLEKWKMTTKIDTSRYEVVAKVYAAILEKKAETVSPQALLEAGDYKRLAEMFENYETMQLNRYYLRNQVLIPMSDELLYCVLRLMIHEGKYNRAAKILDLRRRKGGELGEQLGELQSIVDSIRSILRHLEFGEWAEALALSEEKHAQYQDIPDFTEASLRAREHFALSDEEKSALLKEVDQLGPELLSRDWVCAVRERLASHVEERRRDALKKLEKLNKQTYNGLLKLELAEFLNDQGEGAADGE